MTKIFGTKEWASTTENIMFGCRNSCLYCYAKAMSIRHKKIDIKQWDKPVIRIDKLKKKIGKRKGTIMFPSTHDLHPDDLGYIWTFLDKLLKPGNDVLIVSKPNFEVIASICREFQEYKDQILFRFTIGSANESVLRFWEPGAPGYYGRIASLFHARQQGFKTSVSCEPMLDSEIRKVISEVREAVTDSIWLGKMNDWQRRLKINKAPNIPKILHDNITYWEQIENIMGLYLEFKDDPIIKWKESIKKVVGLELNSEKGMDV